MANDKLPQAHIYYTINPIKWFRLLRENGVSKSKVFEAVKISFFSIISYPMQLLDRALVLHKSKSLKQDDAPVFIIGHWRSGTTYLHYLMAKDDYFGYLSLYQAFLPNITTIGGKLFRQLFKPLVPGKRPQDNIEVDIDVPAEEENAISTFAFESASHSFWFPKNEKYFKKYALFEDATKKDINNWQKAYKRLMTKVAIAFPGKKPLIKNPHNSGRVTQLLKLYPNAKFIHIYRNPLKVLPSTYLMYDKVVTTQFLQDFTEEELHDKIFYYYTSSMTNLLKDIKKIPKQNLYHLKFEDFEINPLSELEAVYKQFGFNHFDDVLPVFEEYVNSKKSYKKNSHRESPISTERILEECAFVFDELDYPMPKTQTIPNTKLAKAR
jgi:hypothetical protein